MRKKKKLHKACQVNPQKRRVGGVKLLGRKALKRKDLDVACLWGSREDSLGSRSLGSSGIGDKKRRTHSDKGDGHYRKYRPPVQGCRRVRS